MSAQLQVTITVRENEEFASEIDVRGEMCSIAHAREVQLDLADNLISYFRDLVEKPVEDDKGNTWAKS